MPSILIDAIIDALAAYLVPFVGGVPIVRGQVNRVPMPQGAFVELTEILTVDLSVPYAGYDTVLGTAILHGPARIDIQVDFYGPVAGDYCKAAMTAFRTGWGFDAFPTDIKPLYMSDGAQSPLITGEQQYETRWTLTASMQYNPTVSVPQQFANALAVNIVNVERAYPA